MKVKQQTLKGFECEIDDAQTFISYYTKNEPLMKGHLLILNGSVDSEVKSFLVAKNAAYIDANEKILLTRKKRSTAVLECPTLEESTVVHSIAAAKKNSTVYHRPIRSGEAIESEDDLVFFARINSGALIESSRSIQVFGIIDGIVRSDGAYMLLQKIGNGSVVFHGEELDKSLFNGQLKLVEYKNNAIVMKDVE